jgi:type IV pilus assembly protein PilV
MEKRSQEKGFSLVESMIALVILTVGLLAVSGMQGVALSRNADANQMSVVTNLAAEMLERVRYNRVNATAYNGIDTGNAATRPSAAQPQARGDYDQWSARLTAAGLTSLRGLVTVTSLTPTALNQNQVAVRVNWSGKTLSHSIVMTTIVVAE